MSYIETNAGFITSSKLKEFARCQFCYKAKYIDGLPDPMEDRDCFTVGTALDELVTQGEQFYQDKYEVVARRSDKAEKVQLTKGQEDIIRQMEKEFRMNPVFADNPNKRAFEIEFGGMKLRGELDDFNEKESIIRDIKTCANVTTFKPEYYLHQMSFYQLLVEEVTGLRCGAFLEVVDKYAYFSRSLPVFYTKDTLFSHRGTILQTLEDLKVAQETGVYLPADSQEVLYGCPFYGTITPEYPHGHGRPVEPLIY